MTEGRKKTSLCGGILIKKYQRPLKLNLKKGSLSRMLEIREQDNIPLTLLRKIKNSGIGKTIKNPTKTGKRRIKITKLLKKRAVFAYVMKTK